MTDSNDRASFAATALATGTGPTPSASGMQHAATASVSGEQAAQAGPIGRVLKGRYKIKRLLGEGGMGGVYEGEHLEIGKRVAIKLVHSLHGRDGHVAARIKQEARSTSAIESEHIVQVFDAGDDDELGLFLVMELLKGEDLGSLLARAKRLKPITAAALVVQAAQGLARAHAAGIVHRDLKPANVFVVTRDDGSSLVKLVDFGIAKLVRDANQQATAGLTRVGMVIGTPQYMSPEQAQGLPSVDHRTDVYSLGAVLFECIVGVSPFQEMPTYEQTILQIMTKTAPRLRDVLPDVPADLDELVAEMLAHDPNQRPQDMMTVRDRLIRVFPEIEHSRAPLRSITNEAALDATAFGGSGSGEVQKLLEQARRPTQSGPQPAVARPGTHSAVAVDRASRPQVQSAEDEPDEIAGVPSKRRGASKAPLIAVAAVLGIAGFIGTAALLRSGGAKEDAKAAGGYGLVQSTVAAPAPSSAPAATTAAPTPPAALPAPAEPPITIPSAAAANAAPAAQPATKPATSHGRHAPAQATAPSASAAEKEQPSARPVGGTSVSNEF